MVAFGAACIAQQKQAINDLNVFPVPDGDTGTNNPSPSRPPPSAQLRRVQPRHRRKRPPRGTGLGFSGAHPAGPSSPAVPRRHEQGVQRARTRPTARSWRRPCQEGASVPAYGAVMSLPRARCLTVSRLAAQRFGGCRRAERRGLCAGGGHQDRLYHPGGDHRDGTRC